MLAIIEIVVLVAGAGDGGCHEQKACNEQHCLPRANLIACSSGKDAGNERFACSKSAPAAQLGEGEELELHLFGI